MPITPERDEPEDDLEDAAPEIAGFIAERPFAALAIAALFGFVIARTIF